MSIALYCIIFLLSHTVVSPSVQPPASTPLSARRGGKRSRFVSPLLQDSREKRVRLDVATDTVKGSRELAGEDGPSRENKEERRVLLAQLEESKEELRKLRMVKMYRDKVSLSQNCHDYFYECSENYIHVLH